ncbi:MAG: hypothetical protein HKM95_03200, partial [Inquilinus sp.]|nr:hypothetical protein [Inquilinus sp.]
MAEGFRIPGPVMRWRHAGAAIGLAVLLGACGGFTPGPIMRGQAAAGGAGDVAACRVVFAAIDRSVGTAGVGDAEAARIAGLPYLRIARFLASFRHRDLDPGAEAAWLDRLAALDRQARTVELANLPAAGQRALGAEIEAIVGRPESPLDGVRRCAAILRRHDFADTGRIEALRRTAYVPDHYAFWPQLFGLYPVSAVAVAAGFESWKVEFLADFADAPEAGPPTAGLSVYRPPATAALLPPRAVAAILAGARRNPLGIAEPTGRDLRALVETFAPVWQVER